MNNKEKISLLKAKMLESSELYYKGLMSEEMLKRIFVESLNRIKLLKEEM